MKIMMKTFSVYVLFIFYLNLQPCVSEESRPVTGMEDRNNNNNLLRGNTKVKNCVQEGMSDNY
jgi:hypothetical protein